MRDYYDELGEEEWHRLARDLPGRVSFAVHRRFLARFVRPGHRVLEVGAGPGRFTKDVRGRWSARRGFGPLIERSVRNDCPPWPTVDSGEPVVTDDTLKTRGEPRRPHD